MPDWTPEPQTFGWLEPPRRRPPTAVGVATPPPPRGPHRVVARRTRRTLLDMIGMAGIVGSLGVVAGLELPLGLLTQFAAGLVALETAAVFQRRPGFRRQVLWI